jgi:hypothetical protein
MSATGLPDAALLRRWAEVGLANIAREYPNAPGHLTRGPDDRPTPRQAHPAFYGSFDWHSAVEMVWMEVRLLRVAAAALPEARIRSALDEHLNREALEREAGYLAEHPGWERPYGWGWALMLAHELSGLPGEQARGWAAAMRPLARVISAQLTAWLPKLAYPVRHGTHPNSAFALCRSLGYARAEEPALAELIGGTARRFFAGDVDYPARYEPSGSDFLSPALTEAELMANLLSPDEFGDWLAVFLPGLADGEPATLFTPVSVTDPSDGQLAHLHGLNLSRAWCWREIAERLPGEDARRNAIRPAIAEHTRASLDAAAGSHYMVEHWLAAYAVALAT